MPKQSIITTSETTNLVQQVREIVIAARTLATQSVDTIQVAMNFTIGQRIVEHEQGGDKRAAYGKQTMEHLAQSMTSEFGRGFSKRNLALMRQFYLMYSPRVKALPAELVSFPQIAQTLSAQFTQEKSEKIVQTASAQLPGLPLISWSHYVFLMGIANQEERMFYEIEAARHSWNLRTLKRQVDSCLYERLALSRDKEGVERLASEGDLPQTPRQLIKDPLVLEFLGLEEKVHYSEHDLESAIIDRLESFLLELGKGFLFEARQKRFSFGTDHFYVDLVFFNRLLRCYVLIDLKIGKLTHQDLGQMQMYVNYFDRHVKLPEENPTVGILLCKLKNDALVELTLPEDANVYASQYQLYLPSKEELQQKLCDWSADSQLDDG
ncbi:PDDEXK nuclease domain-containing protein [Bilophila wadsworthia]|uniref:PDDEXK nuclease domain-containing protein n=1 Tax=Bilophila wadsworthia TaxID=35833 RepID=UPI003521ED5B